MLQGFAFGMFYSRGKSQKLDFRKYALTVLLMSAASNPDFHVEGQSQMTLPLFLPLGPLRAIKRF
jgi:hypothetical protein